MSKSTLSIDVGSGVLRRTIEVPCRLPESFTFKVLLPRLGLHTATAYLVGSEVRDFEGHGWDVTSGEEDSRVYAAAESILSDVKAALGLTTTAHFHHTERSVLSAIALAYEAEVAAYEAAVKAHAALPRALHSPALLPPHPSERAHCYPVLMLARYVEHVVEQACKAQTERAEAQAKVAP